MTLLETVLWGILIAVCSTGHDGIAEYRKEKKEREGHWSDKTLTPWTYIKSQRFQIILNIVAKALVFVVIYAMGTIIWFDILEPIVKRVWS